MRIAIFAIVLVDLLFLLYGVSTLSISYKEAQIYFEGRGFLHTIVLLSTKLLGKSDFTLRLPFILFHLGSLWLFYEISRFYLFRQSDRVLALLVFVLMPGIVSSALLVNSASVVLFFTLLFLYLYLHKRENLYALVLPLFVFVDDAFSVLYLALFAYGVYRKDRFLASLSALLYLVSLYLYGFGVHGKPRGYFLDTFAAYSLIFSPLIFLFFFYTMYRILVREKKSILWFISFTALIYSLLISFRQRIVIEDFAPFLVVSIPLMVRLFLRSYRRRLPALRRTHKLFFMLVFGFLAINFLATYFNQYFYRFLSDPKEHFAYKYHIAKELAQKLKMAGYEEINSTDSHLAQRLRFYGINASNHYQLQKGEDENALKSVTIRYMNQPIVTYSVTKVNN